MRKAKTKRACGTVVRSIKGQWNKAGQVKRGTRGQYNSPWIRGKHKSRKKDCKKDNWRVTESTEAT